MAYDKIHFIYNPEWSIRERAKYSLKLRIYSHEKWKGLCIYNEWYSLLAAIRQIRMGIRNRGTIYEQLARTLQKESLEKKMEIINLRTNNGIR